MPNSRPFAVIPELHAAGDPAAAGIRVPFVRPVMPPLEAIESAVAEIIASGRLTKGPFVERLEQAIADRLGVRHAVAVSSCTIGLLLVYKGLDLSAGSCRSRRSTASRCAVGSMEPLSRFGTARSGARSEPLGEVIIPSFTFLAGPAAIVWNNLRPVFVDVDPHTTNVTVQSVAAAITPRTVAISVCHNFGNPCEIAALESLAGEHGLPLIVDAAHGFGASLHGRPVGAGGTAQVFSLSPTKLLVAGEGGIVATDCDCLAHFVRLGREYGNDGSYDALFAGVNGRMPEFSAAMALASLAMLDGVADRRRQIAARYRRELEQLPGIGFVESMPGALSSHKDFSITIDPTRFGMTRDSVRRALAARGIETRAYYDPACHNQTAFEHFYDRTRALPATELLAARSLSLPLGAHVDEAVVEEVCDAVATAKHH
ncbi:MAG: DegT/DnrJ/EryC1/StrS family aminotransferase [Planctomycetes bacterium]|nr:DegT/DnrJ/EryC1/StrS family aminotransferase [Planctomycetota bacterium]